MARFVFTLVLPPEICCAEGLLDVHTSVSLHSMQIVAIIICMHHWWWDIRKGLSKVIDDTADAFDRRLEAGAMGGILDQAREHERPLNVEGATMRTVWRGEKV